MYTQQADNDDSGSDTPDAIHRGRSGLTD